MNGAQKHLETRVTNDHCHSTPDVQSAQVEDTLSRHTPRLPSPGATRRSRTLVLELVQVGVEFMVQFFDALRVARLVRGRRVVERERRAGGVRCLRGELHGSVVGLTLRPAPAQGDLGQTEPAAGADDHARHVTVPRRPCRSDGHGDVDRLAEVTIVRPPRRCGCYPRGVPDGVEALRRPLREGWWRGWYGAPPQGGTDARRWVPCRETRGISETEVARADLRVPLRKLR